MTLAGFLLKAFSYIPHFNFNFNITKDVFNLDWRSEYIQSLGLLAAAGAVVSVLLLLTITIVWICQSCRANDTTGKTRRRVRRLSTALFIISVACFFMLGICLFANEHVNRGASISINSVINVKRNYKLSISQVAKFQEAALNTSSHLKVLEDLVHTESKKPAVNQTLVREIDKLLTNIIDEVDVIGKKGEIFENLHEDDLARLENIRKTTSTYESERWAFLVIVLSITMCVLFTGVIAFCRQSKKGAVVFSAIGFFIFLVVWVLISVTLPVTVGLTDFCTNGDQFTLNQLSGFYETVKFYNTCKPAAAHDNLPEPLARHVALLNNIPPSKEKLDRLLEIAFNSSVQVTNATSAVGEDVSQMLRVSGAVESSSACYVFHEDIRNFYYGFCDQSVVGMSTFLVSLLVLGLLLFILLIVVSKTWRLFSRLPHEYVEVDDDDPFFPRGANDSTIPVDIYGTHVFNPRTRDRTEPSTNTTTGTGDEQLTPLWNHSATAPPVSNSMARSPFNDHPYGNYADRYDLS